MAKYKPYQPSRWPWRVNRAERILLRRIALCVLSLGTSSGWPGSAAFAEATPTVPAPGYGTLAFTPPVPGSYRLPILGRAADGRVLADTAESVNLHDLMGDKIVLLSFIYATCSDINGCFLATAVFHKIKRRLQQQPELSGQLRLLTLSFDPQHDGPEQMRRYSEGFADKMVDWRFLTTALEAELEPILAHYGQNIQKIYDAQGSFTGSFSHNLRVYLIDRDKNLRNIYSTAFLHPDTLINDIKTLLQEPPQNRPSASAMLTGPVDKAVDLMETIRRPPLGLPPVPQPLDNPVTEKKIQLGRKLFFDRRLSLNDTLSCALCHIPEQGFTSQEMQTAVGIEGRTVRRNSPTLYNVAYANTLFHDSRETTLEQQVWGPLLAPNEMGNPAIGSIIEKIKHTDNYLALFEQAFGQRPDMATIGMAITSYERTLNSANSAFDRWYYGKDKQALNAAARRGFELFTGKAHCSRCHTISQQHALFTDNALHNTGIGYADSMAPVMTPQKLEIAPGIIIEVDKKQLVSVSEVKPNDLGRYEITQNPADRWRYKTPSLRNIGLTAPYMHNGSLATLEDVLVFYNEGGIANENLDPLLEPLKLNDNELSDLKAFLEALTGDNTVELVADALTAPIGDSE